MRVSASTMRVRVAFSIVNLVLPFCGQHENQLLMHVLAQWPDRMATRSKWGTFPAYHTPQALVASAQANRHVTSSY